MAVILHNNLLFELNIKINHRKAAIYFRLNLLKSHVKLKRFFTYKMIFANAFSVRSFEIKMQMTEIKQNKVCKYKWRQDSTLCSFIKEMCNKKGRKTTVFMPKRGLNEKQKSLFWLTKRPILPNKRCSFGRQKSIFYMIM